MVLAHCERVRARSRAWYTKSENPGACALHALMNSLSKVASVARKARSFVRAISYKLSSSSKISSIGGTVCMLCSSHADPDVVIESCPCRATCDDGSGDVSTR